MFDVSQVPNRDGDDPIDAASATEDELVARAVEIEQRRTALDAEQAAVLGELEARGTCDREFGLTTAPWLAREVGQPIVTMKNRVRVARKLRHHLPLVAAALDSGRITWEHVRVIVEVANPRILDVVVDNQELLLGLADRCIFEQWRAEVRALARLWDQDGGYDPNEDPNANRLSFGRTIDGLTSLAATLTGENGEVVTQAIEAKTDELYRRAVEDEKVCPDLKVPSRSTLRALALTELIRQALGIDLDSTKGPKVEATMVVDADDPTSASDPDGVRLADGTSRVLLCDAELHALVVDSLGVPLDLGRHARWATEGQRRAVRRRDGGCTFPGCDAKVMWCDVHHCVHYGDKGVTDLCNLVCLCRHHHGVTHRKGWSARVDGDGWPIFTTPSGFRFWGQRHGRQREGPPPDPLEHPVDQRPPGGFEIIPGRYRRTEDPFDAAHARQLTLRRLAPFARRAA